MNRRIGNLAIATVLTSTVAGLTVIAAQQRGTPPGTEQAAATAANCNQPARTPIVHVAIPGSPFTALPTADGCWVFVSSSAMNAPANRGVAVLKRAGGELTLARFVPFDGAPTGMTLTHDGALLIVANGDNIAFLDTARLISGEPGAVLGFMAYPDALGRIFVNTTADDSLLFVSEERSASISVIDLPRARRSNFSADARIGTIPVGRAPIALTFSPDGKYLYTTSQVAPASLRWPIDCRPEGSDPATPKNHAKGAVIVIDVAKAGTDPAHATVATVPAGCNPVRLTMTPRGDRVYVTARGDNALLAFDAKALATGASSALVATVPVGTSPVGVITIDNGARVIVTNSNRFAGGPSDSQSLTVIDASRIFSGAAAVAGSIEAGAFPRELRTSSDGRTLFVTNFSSKTVEMVDLRSVSIGKR